MQHQKPKSRHHRHLFVVCAVCYSALLLVCIALFLLLPWVFPRTGEPSLIFPGLISAAQKPNRSDGGATFSSKVHSAKKRCLTNEAGFIDTLARQKTYRPSQDLEDEARLKELYPLFYHFYNELWSEVRSRLPVRAYNASDETKYFIEFVDRNTSSCSVVTLGMGRDVEAERALLQTYPQCKFVGVDPEEEENRELVEGLNGGRFIKTAVAASAGNYSGRIMMKKEYGQHEVYHTSFVKLLSEFADRNELIDLLLIDVESAELPILESIPRDYKRLPKICQINVEVHNPEQFGMSYRSFFATIEKLIDHQHFILLNDDFTGNLSWPYHYHRLFLMNIHEQRCLEKYLCR